MKLNTYLLAVSLHNITETVILKMSYMMVAYEFYVQDNENGRKLIGILPERRTDPARINHDSIMNWARIVFGNIFEKKNINYIKITLLENNSGNYFSKEES